MAAATPCLDVSGERLPVLLCGSIHLPTGLLPRPDGLPLPGGSPEDQIRSAITSYEEAWNASDYDAIAKVLCKKFLKGVSKDNFTKTREEDGQIHITVESIKVDGETATANVVNEFTNRDEPDKVEWKFVREDGAWKRCDVD